MFRVMKYYTATHNKVDKFYKYNVEGNKLDTNEIKCFFNIKFKKVAKLNNVIHIFIYTTMYHLSLPSLSF